MKTKLTLFVTVLASALFLGGCASIEMPPFVNEGLVAYYPFNGNAKDESGNGNDGEVNGRVSFGIDRHGSPLKTGVFGAGHITVDKPKGLSSTNSISCWIKIDRIGPPQYPIDLGHINVHNIEIIRDSGIVRTGNKTNDFIDSKTELAAGKWYFLTRTYDGSSKIVIYIDGRLDKLGNAGTTKPDRITIGKSGQGEGSYIFFGPIDDIRIYDRALSGEEVKALYDLEKPKSKTK